VLADFNLVEKASRIGLSVNTVVTGTSFPTRITAEVEYIQSFGSVGLKPAQARARAWTWPAVKDPFKPDCSHMHHGAANLSQPVTSWVTEWSSRRCRM